MNIETKTRIDNLVSQIEEVKQRIVSAEQGKQENLAQLSVLLDTLPIQDMVSLIPEDVRPTIIPVEKPGRPLVMMIPKQAPSFGVLVWKEQWNPGSTGAWLRFRTGILEGGFFYMPCGCCCYNSDETIPSLREFNEKNPNPNLTGKKDLSVEEWGVRWEKYRKEHLHLYIALHQNIAMVSKKHGIHHVFVRRPEKWEVFGSIPGLLMVEGGKLYSSITKWYGENAARSFFSHWKSHR